jgi:predicted 2-oxoglutarate/Fe(II)-dependent dioxygenase YbiX
VNDVRRPGPQDPAIRPLLVVPDAWAPEFCREVQQAMDEGDADDAEIVDGATSVDLDVRRALDITVADDVLTQVEAALMIERDPASRYFGIELSGSVGASCLRYLPGGHYRRHRDRDPEFGDDTSARLITVVVWLNSADTPSSSGAFAGGTLVVTDPVSGHSRHMVPEVGTLVAFPAEWPHEVLPVTRGIRDVVVDWWT